MCRVHLTVSYYHVTYEFESEFTLYSLPECQGTPCSKQAPYLKFKWQQRDSNSHPLSLWMHTRPFSQTGQMIDLCCEYFYVGCIWLYVIIMSHTSLRVNSYSIVCLNVKDTAWRRRYIWSLSDSKEIRTLNHVVCKYSHRVKCTV